ncbi:hypothetical protein ABZP36_004252 [Zizania latifolia]
MMAWIYALSGWSFQQTWQWHRTTNHAQPSELVSTMGLYCSESDRGSKSSYSVPLLLSHTGQSFVVLSLACNLCTHSIDKNSGSCGFHTSLPEGLQSEIAPSVNLKKEPDMTCAVVVSCALEQVLACQATFFSVILSDQMGGN